MMATHESFEGAFPPSRFLDLIQKLMIAPVHDQIGAVKEDVDLAVRLAAEAELKSTSTARNLEEQVSQLRTALGQVGNILEPLVYSSYCTRYVLIHWVATSSFFASSSAMAGLRDDSLKQLELAELSNEYFEKIMALAVEAASVTRPEKVTELANRLTGIGSDILPRLQAIIAQLRTSAEGKPA